MPSVKRFLRTAVSDSLPNLCAAGCFLLVLTAMAAFTGQWCWQPNGYNSYSLQADAWLHGQLDLGRDYPWLELAIYEGRYYVSFPPFPSYILLPFSLIWGTHTPDGWISLFFSLAGVWTCVSLARQSGRSSTGSVALTLFLYLGTGYLFIALTPAVWFFAQTLCFNLCIFALYAAMRQRGGMSLTAWACAVGCRPMVILYLPALLILLWHSYHESHPRDSLYSTVKKHWYWSIGPLFLAISYMMLNYNRFGSIFEFGHNYLPEFQRAEYGQFSLTYLGEHLSEMIRLPSWNPETQRLAFQPFETWCFVLINPLSLLAVAVSVRRLFKTRGPVHRGLILAILASSMVYALFLCCHRTLGGWQFGNRYFKDIMPFLFCALCLTMPDNRHLRSISTVLFAWSVSLHLLGTVITWNYWW